MSRRFSGPVFDSVAGVARLAVPADRTDDVRESVEKVYGLIDKLDELDLGETPPATAFDARWE
jgi:Asp-tRNA(Asn)/Glu-tRNA(Gln) amidotransferase C subunit